VSNRRAVLEVLHIRVRSRRVCWWTSFCSTISSALVEMGGEPTASYAIPTTRIRSSRAPLPNRFRNYRSGYRRNRQVAFLPSCMSSSAASMANSCACSSSSPTRRQTTNSRPLDISHTSKSSVNLSQSQRLLPANPVHHWDGMCSGSGDTWRPHHRASPRRGTSRPAAPQHGLR